MPTVSKARAIAEHIDANGEQSKGDGDSSKADRRSTAELIARLSRAMPTDGEQSGLL